MVAPTGHVVIVVSTVAVVTDTIGPEELVGGEVGAIGMLVGQLVMIPGLLGINAAQTPTRYDMAPCSSESSIPQAERHPYTEATKLSSLQ